LFPRQHPAGGDLCAALQEDIDCELSWYAKGHEIALDIARGLYFLHSHGVRCPNVQHFPRCELMQESLQTWRLPACMQVTGIEVLR